MAKPFAVLYGPNLPDRGSYAIGESNKELFRSIMDQIGTVGVGALSASDADLIDIWLARGYSLLVLNQDGQVLFYGSPVKIEDVLVQGLGLKSDSPIVWIRFSGTKTACERAPAAILGVTQTPEKELVPVLIRDFVGLASRPPMAPPLILPPPICSPPICEPSPELEA